MGGQETLVPRVEVVGPRIYCVCSPVCYCTSLRCHRRGCHAVLMPTLMPRRPALQVGAAVAFAAAAVMRTHFFRSEHMPLESSLVTLFAFGSYML